MDAVTLAAAKAAAKQKYIEKDGALRGLTPTKYGQVLTVGAAGAFDAALVESPAIWKDPSGLYGMVYVAYTQASGNNGGAAAAVEASIGLAWSSDLKTWTKAGQLLAKSGAGADSAGCTGPVMILEGGVYHLFYIGLTASGYEGGTPTLCHATSTDLVTWTRDAANPIINVAATTWRSNAVYHPSFVKKGSTWYCFFNAMNAASHEEIGYATASSLSGPWTVDDVNSPILTRGAAGAWDAQLVGDPSVYQHTDGSWVMHFYGVSASFTSAGDGIATTTDASFPLGWTKSTLNPTLVAGTTGAFDDTYAHKPFAFVVGTVVYHFYTAQKTGGGAKSIGLAIDSGYVAGAVHQKRANKITTPANDNEPPLWVTAKSSTVFSSTVVFGDDIKPGTAVGRTRVVYGNSGASSEALMGQDATHCLVLSWTYNATAGSAKAGLSTFGNTNEIDIDGSVVKIQAGSGKDVTLGKSAPATTATAGFPYIPANAGAPTGVPAGQAGFVPCYYDTTNHKLWIYDGGWKGVVVA